MSTNEDLPLWTVDRSDYLVDDKFMKLRVDACTTPDGGKVDKYFVVECQDWANCLVIDADGNAIILKHYRHGTKSYLAELVAGGIEPDDVSPEAAIRRELEEEAGYTGGTLYNVGVGYPNPAFQTNKVYSFLAVGGSIGKPQNLEAGETILVEKIPFATWVEQIRAPEATHPSMYVATMFYALHFIQNSSDPALQKLKKLI